MNNKSSYIEVLLKSALNLKNRDSLYISISINDKDTAEEVIRQAKEIGAQDIFVFYNDVKTFDNKIHEYTRKKAKFLFFTEDNKKSLNMDMINYILNNDLEIDYTVAVSPNNKIIRENDVYYYSSITGENDLQTWNKIMNDNNKVVSQIKNFRLNKLKVENLLDTELNMKVSPLVRGNNEYKTMNLFPNYKVELVPEKGSANGFIAATAPVILGEEKLEELRMVISGSTVIDYDCSSNSDQLKTILNINNNPVVESIGLITKDTPAYNNFSNYNNMVLDRTATPYVIISSYDKINDEKYKLIVPIGGGKLKVTGYNENGKNINIYGEENFSNKIKRK